MSNLGSITKEEAIRVIDALNEGVWICSHDECRTFVIISNYPGELIVIRGNDTNIWDEGWQYCDICHKVWCDRHLYVDHDDPDLIERVAHCVACKKPDYPEKTSEEYRLSEDE